MTNNGNEFPMLFFLFSISVELRMAPAQNNMAGITKENKKRKSSLWTEGGPLWNTECGKSPHFWVFFSFTFPYSLNWPCPKFSLSHRAAMWQLCRHLKFRKPVFWPEEPGKNSVDRRVWEEPPLPFFYRFIM